MHRRTTKVGRLLVAVAGIWIGCAVPARAAPDVRGTWLLRAAGVGAFVEIEQTGNALSFPYAGVALSGTVSDAGRIQATGTASGVSVIFDGDISGDATLMNASAARVTLATVQFEPYSILGQRCGCTDGNTKGGDGCDADCQIEPCWNCSGNPSSCARAEDGTACARGDCVVEASCAAGACVGGGSVAACIDLTGTWAVHASTTLLGFPTTSDFLRSITQRNGLLRIRDDTHEYFGTIDPSTGALAWTRLSPIDLSGLCTPTAQTLRLPFVGSATPHDTFGTTGVEAIRVSRCPLPADVIETGVRSAPLPTTTTTSVATTSSTTSTTTSTLPTPPDLRTAVPARKLVLRDDVTPPVAAAGRRLVLKAATRGGAARIVPPATFGAGDPTIHGATLDMYNGTGSGERVQLALPKEGWRTIASGRGYRYTRRFAGDPVSTITILPDHLVLRAGGAGLGYSLDEPRQGRLVVSLRFGPEGGICVDVPGKTDVSGKFVAVPNALAPGSCAPLP